MSGKPPTRFRLELRHTRSAADGKPQPQPCRGCSSRHRELAVPSSHSGIAGQGWSAVAQEYLNGKEIVTGSTPLSPIAKFSSQGGFAELPASKVNADIGVSCSCHCCLSLPTLFPQSHRLLAWHRTLRAGSLLPSASSGGRFPCQQRRRQRPYISRTAPQGSQAVCR